MPAGNGCNGDVSVTDEMIFGPAVPEVEMGISKRIALHDASGTAGRRLPEQDDGVAQAVPDLATGLAPLLVAVIRNLQKQDLAEIRDLSKSVSEQQQRLEEAVQGLTAIKESIDRLTETIAPLQEADRRHEAGLAALDQGSQERLASAAERLEACCSRVDGQQQELSAVKSSVSELAPRVDEIFERLDSQAVTIRSMCEAETLSEIALDRFVEVWAQLKASAPGNAPAKVSL